MKEKLEDLAHWLAKLKGSLMNTNTDDDPEEAERRVQLEKFAPCIRLSCPQTDCLQVLRRHRKAVSSIVRAREDGTDSRQGARLSSDRQARRATSASGPHLSSKNQSCRVLVELTHVTADVPAAVDTKPSRTIGCEFLTGICTSGPADIQSI